MFEDDGKSSNRLDENSPPPTDLVKSRTNLLKKLDENASIAGIGEQRMNKSGQKVVEGSNSFVGMLMEPSSQEKIRHKFNK